jgi:hypothetical protein
VKTPVSLAVVAVFLLATVCSAACPDVFQSKSCHSENQEDQKGKDVSCFGKHLLLAQKEFSEAIGQMAVRISLPLPAPTVSDLACLNPLHQFSINLRSVALRI